MLVCGVTSIAKAAVMSKSAKAGPSRQQISQGIMRSRGKTPTRSVVHSNVNILLAGVGDNFLLLLALKVGQLLDSLLDDLESTLDLLVSDDKRWCQSNDVLVGGFRLWKYVSSICHSSV